MAVNFVARKCACGGTLEFNALKKIWVCKYCGTTVEREATFDKIHVDGIEGISDVVRQTLMDIANLKMDSAQRNLEDCERKDYRHVGTLLAHISYNLTNISVAKSQDEARASLDKVKIYAKRLQEDYPVIAEDEINLYEALGEEAADIYGHLLVVFDTLGDGIRLEYIASKLRLQEIFSPYVNKTLLKIFIKQNKLDRVDLIIANIGHIDKKSALQEVINTYPDNEKKAGLIRKLFDAKTAEALTKKYFEMYFIESKDSIETKGAVLSLLNTTNIHCSANIVVKAISPLLDTYNKANYILNIIYDVKISDEETEDILTFCLITSPSYNLQSAFFDVIIEKSVFVALNGQTVISFLESSHFASSEKAEILKKMLKLQIERKALDAIYNYYLNSNTDEQESRRRMIEILLIEGSPISINTAKKYIIKTSIDGKFKKVIVEKIFATGINKTYLGDILSEYLLYTTDSKEQKKEISDYLITLGFTMDSGAFLQYILSDEEDVQKIAKMKQLIANGTMVKADTLHHYILSLKNPNDFSVEIFNLLTQNDYSICLDSYAKFVLFCKDMDKIRHNEKMLKALNSDVAGQRISILHCTNQLNCNIAQAYILCSEESYENAYVILQQLLNIKTKLNTDILANGAVIKFKKYVGEHKNELSPVSLQLCNEHKMFSLF